MNKNPYPWRKSSHSEADGNCVEADRSPEGTIGVRDSKQGGASVILGFTRRQWAAFLQAVRCCRSWA